MKGGHERHHALHHHRNRAIHAGDDSITGPTATRPQPILDLEPVKRAPAPSETCPGSKCQLPTSSKSTTTLPIVLGAIIPITVAVIVLLFLHRRLVKKRRIEDANYKHKSLDFGLGEFSGQGHGKNRRAPPEMALSPSQAGDLMRPSRGVSMDMGSPYVLPGELQENRPSFHSLSRSNNDEDPYHAVALMKSRSNSPNPPQEFKDAASAKTGSSSDSGPFQSFKSSTNLLGTPVDRPSRTSSVSKKSQGEKEDQPLPPVPTIEIPKPAITRKPIASPPAELEDTKPFSPPPRSDSSLPNSAAPEITVSSQPESTYDHTTPIPRRMSSQAQQMGSLNTSTYSKPQSSVYDEYATYADVLGIVQEPTTSPPQIHEPEYVPDGHIPEYYDTDMHGLGVHNVSYDNRRLSVRPLPPEDPSDNAEQRANRIRSFYKEYFDDSKNGHDDYGFQDYWEDYGQEYLNDATIYDPTSGQFIVAGAPYQEPITRRAMTPPPRGPPRFRGGPAPPGRYSSGSQGMPPPGGRFRAYSSASGRPPVGGRGRPPKRPLPPPKPLKELPTPHMLKDDSAIFSAADFAPPQIFKDQRAGRPASPLGGQRPYSPSVRAHTPLMSPFEDLAAMPSPHHLRKSGTFTALDFAPPPRIKSDTASDAGSIRSGRSNVSARQLHNIRTGAYRVSRLPADMVGTQADLAASLKPSWQQRA